MITNETIIHPVNPGEGKVSALDVAQSLYDKWNAEAKETGHETVSLPTDLIDYMRNGLVIARPDIFGMAKLVKWKGGLAWFVRMAVGDLRTLMAELPLQTTKILFCRKGSLRIREYTQARLLKLATRERKLTT